MASRSSRANSLDSASSTSPKAVERRRDVLCDRLLLLRGAYLDLRLEGSAAIQRREHAAAEAPDGVIPVLQHEQIAADAGHAAGERNARQPGGLGLLDAVERGRDALLRRDDVGAPLQQLRRQPRRYGRRQRDELRRCREVGCGIPAEQELQCAQGLLERELHLSKAVAIGLQVEARDGDVEVAPDSDLQPLRGQIEELRGGIHHLGEHRLLHRGLGREKP